MITCDSAIPLIRSITPVHVACSRQLLEATAELLSYLEVSSLDLHPEDVEEAGVRWASLKHVESKCTCIYIYIYIIYHVHTVNIQGYH